MKHQVAFFFKEGGELLVGHVQGAAIDPAEVGSFWAVDLQRGAAVDLLAEVVHVALDVGVELVQPLVTLGVGRDDNVVYKGVCTADVQVVQQGLELVAQLLILNNDVGSLQASQVEGLARCGAQDGGARPARRRCCSSRCAP